ncbi:type VI secretion system Vgr family protein [Burkholderia contaminans]|uniref:Type VI secretion system tip protein VgrG n=1 Tax=Burkholderia contaminans TaxID=488447 RepID=A0A3N8Q053_9BURK|nr:type VI secretion system Vgr family protein [Burkholderia contaminans]RQT17228.1 type VI secretion system tip protein VgrG [Burkholderia contaminans]
MYSPAQSRVVSISGVAIPEFAGQPILLPIKLIGDETLGKLSTFTLELRTLNLPALPVYRARDRIEPDKLVGTELTISIEFDGKGTFVPGMAGEAGQGNLGAGKREVTGLIAELVSTGEDDRYAYYEMKVRPWLWLATLNRENRIFQNKNVVQITEAVLSSSLYPFKYEWRLGAIGLGGGYPARDYVRQVWESDFDFLARLWSEWGIYYFMDGSTLVLCDSPGAHHPHENMYDAIFYRAPAGARIDEEHIHALKVSRLLTPGAASVVDYDPTQSRAKMSNSVNRYSEIAFDNAEHYAWGDYSQPLAGTMGLSGTPNDTAREARYLAGVRVDAERCKGRRAKGRGNLRGLAVGHTFRVEGHPQKAINTEFLVIAARVEICNSDQATGGEPYHCVTDFVVQPANAVFRSPLQKKPPCGPETAVVVGPENQPMWIDGYARVKVQFVWDRLGKRDENSSCWVRVSSPWQGGGFGFVALPRIGQEVTVSYHEGDADKPYVSDRQVNQFNQPPWELPKNQALMGWRSLSLAGGQVNQVVVDDTPNQLQVQVTSDHAQSRLVLGYNTRIEGRPGRLEARGEGFELATMAWGVMRANRGILITTEARDGAAQPAKDMVETVERLSVARDQQDTFATTAREQQVQEAGDQDEVAKALQAQRDDIQGSGLPNAQAGQFPEMRAPLLVLAGAAGIATTTSRSTHLASGEHLALTAGGHVGVSVGKRLLVSVARGVRTLVQSCGWKLVAMSGDIELKALKDNLTLLAKLNMTATANRITISAQEELVVSGGGSATQYTSGGITHMTAGGYTAHAGSFTYTGPKSRAAVFPEPPPPGKGNLELFNTYAIQRGVMSSYRVEDALGRVATGVLSANGYAAVSGMAPGPAHVTFGTDNADPWSPGSYARKAGWPDGASDDARKTPAGAPVQAREIASQVLSGAAAAAHASRQLSQLAGAFNAGGAGSLLGTGLSGAGALLGAAGATANAGGGPGRAGPTMPDVRTPGFV